MKENSTKNSLSDRQVFLIYTALFIVCIVVLTKYKSLFFESFMDRSTEQALYLSPENSSNIRKIKLNVNFKETQSKRQLTNQDNRTERNILNSSSFPATIVKNEQNNQLVQSNVTLTENYSTGRTHSTNSNEQNEGISTLQPGIFSIGSHTQNSSSIQMLADNSNANLSQISTETAQMISSPDPGEDPGAEEMIPVYDSHTTFIFLLIAYALYIYYSKKKRKKTHIELKNK